MQFDAILLLTGTPVHNNLEELWTLLNLVDEDKFNDPEEFVFEYGGLKSSEKVCCGMSLAPPLPSLTPPTIYPSQLERLHTLLRPLLLRRVKDDVEKSIPPKEETIIHVELTTQQKKYYRAIFERNRKFLVGTGRTMPVANLINLQVCLPWPLLVVAAVVHAALPPLSTPRWNCESAASTRS